MTFAPLFPVSTNASWAIFVLKGETLRELQPSEALSEPELDLHAFTT